MDSADINFKLMPWGPTFASAPDDGDRDPTPWGLDSDWLRAGKTITDPVHGDIHLNRLETALLNSPPLQRLRRVRQLGTTHLVYPGATHSRLSHALGTVRQAQKILEALLENHYGSHWPPVTLFTEWIDEGAGFEVLLAEATVLARLGALLHDIGHVPFGHTVEDDLEIMESHDSNRPRFDALWADLSTEAREAIDVAQTARPLEGRLTGLGDEVRRLILSAEKKEGERASRYPFVADVVGNTICADLLDYIARDHLYTGLPLDVGSRFLASFFVVGKDVEQQYGEHLAVRVVRGARKRWDVVTELLKYLRFRYELNERALDHHAKIAADALLSLLLDRYSVAVATDILTENDRGGREHVRSPAQGHLARSESRAANAGEAYVVGAVPTATNIPDDWGALCSRYPYLRPRVTEALEALFVSRSDDSLLEYLAEYYPKSSHDAVLKPSDEVREHARALLARQLPKTLGVSSHVSEDKRQWVWERLGVGRVSERRKLERRLARLVGEPYVLLWVPDPRMHLKPAGVLIDDGIDIGPLKDKEQDAHAIETKHRGLWRITVLGPRQLRDNHLKVEIVLSVIAEDLTMAIVDHARLERPRSYEEIRVDVVARRLGSDQGQLRELAGSEVARGRQSSFASDCERLAIFAQEEGLVQGFDQEQSWLDGDGAE